MHPYRWRGTCAIANIAIGDVAEWRIDRSPGPSTRAKRRPALLTVEMLSGRRPWLVAKPVGATSVAGNNGSELLRSGRFSRLSVLEWLFAGLFARRVAYLFVQIRRLDKAVREAHELRVLSLVQIDLSQGVVVRPRGSDCHKPARDTSAMVFLIGVATRRL